MLSSQFDSSLRRLKSGFNLIPPKPHSRVRILIDKIDDKSTTKATVTPTAQITCQRFSQPRSATCKILAKSHTCETAGTSFARFPEFRTHDATRIKLWILLPTNLILHPHVTSTATKNQPRQAWLEFSAKPRPRALEARVLAPGSTIGRRGFAIASSPVRFRPLDPFYHKLHLAGIGFCCVSACDIRLTCMVHPGWVYCMT